MLRIRFRSYPIRTVGGKRPRNGEGMTLQLTDESTYHLRSRTACGWAKAKETVKMYSISPEDIVKGGRRSWKGEN